MESESTAKFAEPVDSKLRLPRRYLRGSNVGLCIALDVGYGQSPQVHFYWRTL